MTCVQTVSKNIGNIILDILPTVMHMQETNPPGPEGEIIGGFDCQFVKPPSPVLRTECPVCRLILCDPYQTKCCGTNFCHSCIQKVKADKNPCPNCRKVNFEFFQDMGLQRSLTQLHVLCTHRDCCKWTGELGNLKHHWKKVHSGTSCQIELDRMVCFLCVCFVLGLRHAKAVYWQTLVCTIWLSPSDSTASKMVAKIMAFCVYRLNYPRRPKLAKSPKLLIPIFVNTYYMHRCTAANLAIMCVCLFRCSNNIVVIAKNKHDVALVL